MRHRRMNLLAGGRVSETTAEGYLVGRGLPMVTEDGKVPKLTGKNSKNTKITNINETTQPQVQDLEKVKENTQTGRM